MNGPDPFESLDREAPPPPRLRARLQEDLARRGLVRRRRGPDDVSRAAWRGIAAVLVFALGVAAGMQRSGAKDSAATTEAPVAQFALLLYEPAGFDSTRSHEELAAEYGAWATSMRGQVISGEALGAQRILGAGPDAVGTTQPTGYFIVRAALWEDALAIARTCPHLRHGGVVAVREIIG